MERPGPIDGPRATDATPATDTCAAAAGAPHTPSLPHPPPPRVLEWRPEPARPGQLTPAWRVVFFIGWIGVVLALAAVWKSGRTLGLAPWWLGPSGDPHSIAVSMIPFVLPVAAVVAAIRNMRHLPYTGIVAALAVAAVAAGDASRFAGISVVEFAAAGAGLLVSIASFAGLLRGEPAPPAAG